MFQTKFNAWVQKYKNQLSRIKNNENTELLERIYMYYDKYD